jgi:hypothetical protein
MDPVEAADTVQETAEDIQAANERFRRRAGLTIGILAMLLAIASLGGDNATKEMVNANIQASDTWAFYQAKNVRQTSVQLAADELETRLATEPDLSPEARAQLQQRLDSYRSTVARYESEPETGEGKRELLARAQQFEARRERAQRQDPNFDYAQALFQIAIVIGSVSILTAARPLLWLAIGLGSVATLLMLNGFLLVVNLPIG